MRQDTHSVFLERRAYRQRRLADAARMLPLFGAALICLPMLWVLAPGQTTPTTYVMSFLFVVWVGLIALSAWVSSRLPKDGPDADPPKDE